MFLGNLCHLNFPDLQKSHDFCYLIAQLNMTLQLFDNQCEFSHRHLIVSISRQLNAIQNITLQNMI